MHPASFSKFFSWNFVKLGFRIVQVKYVDAFHAEIPPASLQLIRQVTGSHAVATRGDFLGAENAVFRNSREKYSFASAGISPSGVRNPAFVHSTISSRENPCRTQLLQRLPDRPLAALKAVIDRRVDHIEPAFDRSDHRAAIRFVGCLIRLSQICADADRGKNQPGRSLPKMPRGGLSLENARRIAACRRRSPNQESAYPEV